MRSAWAARSLTGQCPGSRRRGAAADAAVAVGQDVPLGRGHADGREAGQLVAGVAEVNGPQDVHLPADHRIGMPVAVGQHSRLLVGGQRRTKPSSHP